MKKLIDRLFLEKKDWDYADIQTVKRGNILVHGTAGISWEDDHKVIRIESKTLDPGGRTNDVYNVEINIMKDDVSGIDFFIKQRVEVQPKLITPAGQA